MPKGDGRQQRVGRSEAVPGRQEAIIAPPFAQGLSNCREYPIEQSVVEHCVVEAGVDPRPRPVLRHQGVRAVLQPRPERLHGDVRVRQCVPEVVGSSVHDRHVGHVGTGHHHRLRVLAVALVEVADGALREYGLGGDIEARRQAAVLVNSVGEGDHLQGDVVGWEFDRRTGRAGRRWSLPVDRSPEAGGPGSSDAWDDHGGEEKEDRKRLDRQWAGSPVRFSWRGIHHSL
mmetsp:Transcript_5004/g.10523  ORF Transcript_5004/g.10523 Transcript_5004/m.10523 type:complete len:230 (-) Transcript_5004:61-750(-)